MKEKEFHQDWRKRLGMTIYETDTYAGKVFDIALFGLIILSVIYVSLESVGEIDKKYHKQMVAVEWIITILFSVEYILRVVTLKKPRKYIFSFYGCFFWRN